jgi:hypothetical protein
MGEVLRDELTDFIRLAESINELIIKLYIALGEITSKSEAVFIRNVQPVIEFVNDYVNKRKEAFAISYYRNNSVKVIHENEIFFYVQLTEDPGKIPLQELYDHIFNDSAVKGIVLNTAVFKLVRLLRDNIEEVEKKIDLNNSTIYLKLAIKKARDPAILDKAKLLLAEAVILMDEFSAIHMKIESLIEKLRQVDSISQLEGVIRDLNFIVSILEHMKHLVDKAESLAKKAETLAICVEKFAHMIERIKKEAENQYVEEESEDEL